MVRRHNRAVVPSAVTTLELVVVVAIIGILVGLLLPAVQNVRASADRASCANRLRQLGLALHQYSNDRGALPPATDTDKNGPYPYLSWQARLLPYVEQGALWERTEAAFKTGRPFTENPPHVGLATVLPAVACPADSSARSVQTFVPQYSLFPATCTITLTSYLGVSGSSRGTQDGVLYERSAVRPTDILDGLSNTLAVGERPAPGTFRYGWWYAGGGVYSTGAIDSYLGVREAAADVDIRACPPTPGRFGPGRQDNPCDALHFWSFHSGGGHFLLCDGAVRFFRYDADAVLTGLATRSGGEVVSIPD